MMGSSVRDGHHIAINGHLLSGQAGYRSAGVHQYIHYLLRHLAQADDGLHYTVFVGRETQSPDPAIVPLRSAHSSACG